MVNDLISMVREKSIAPFCTLSDRGLQAVFSGAVDVIHIAKGKTLSVSREGCQYMSILRGTLDIADATGRHAGVNVRSHDTAISPYVFYAENGALRLRAHDDTLVLYGSGDAIDDIVAIDTLVKEKNADIDVLQLVLMRSAKSFATLSTSALIDIYTHMSVIPVAAGEEIIRQNTKGDRFYFIREGAAEVWREDLDDDEPKHVATLATGDGFGEEALILSGGRNATVKMITPGCLLSLDAEQYNERIAKSAVVRIPIADAQQRIAQGVQLLDVRYEDEWNEGFIPGAIHIPLSTLRARIGELDKSKEIIVYCRSGKRSQVGAILLSQHGYKASSMDGGTTAWPHALATA